MLPERLSVECKLHENVHLGGLLTDDELTVVLWRQLIQSEEAQVGEDLVNYCIVAIRTARVLLKKDSCEDLHLEYKHNVISNSQRRCKEKWSGDYHQIDLLTFRNS